MSIYILVFLIAVVYSFISRGKLKHSDVLLSFFLLYLTIFVGFGDMIGGYDRYIYGASFDFIADEMKTTGNYEKTLYLMNGIEYGYWLWQVIIAFITENRYVFLFLTVCLEYILIFFTFKKYINDYPLCSIVFLGFFYYFTMTYLREVIAVGIAWQGVRYIWERKPIKFFLILGLAATFHTSVLIFAISYFIPFKKFAKKNVIYFLVFCLLIGLTPIPNMIIAHAGDITGKEGNYTSQDQGFRIEYVIEVIFILWILFKNYSRIPTDKGSLVMLNMCYTLCAILFVFMRFGQGGRFGWPFFLGVFYMFTFLSSRKGALVWMRPSIITVCFLLFLRITIAWSALNVPYKTFLTNGPCAGNGSTYSANEYDYGYTQNKFYRPIFKFLK
ncbi:Uncharacterised protein [Prevotella melaninogenica]|uniref:EpsG family protein n=1 Tax=Prevotella melaninogenica TaxID=28132 RepID=UPI00195DC0C3|nr:EpsG family protein [Prevotella melaninogenica]VTY05632.1 Uncharacterised protein [Prevotella melaninogenica]